MKKEELRNTMRNLYFQMGRWDRDMLESIFQEETDEQHKEIIGHLMEASALAHTYHVNSHLEVSKHDATD